MKNIMLFLVLIALMVPSNIFAADDPGIPRETKDKVQIAMQAHINGLLAKNGGSYPIFDADTQNVVQLKFLALHKGVVVKGSQGKYYISCADFTDKENKAYDLDFLVSDHFEVVETLIHKKDGKKMHYGVH